MSEMCDFCDENESSPLKKFDKLMLEGLGPPIIDHQMAFKICLCCRKKLNIAHTFKLKYAKAIEKYQNGTHGPKNNINLNMNECDSKIVLKKSTVNDAKMTKIVGTKSKRSFECHICLRRFNLKGELGTHVKRHATKQKPHYCDNCQLEFLCLPHIKEHKCSIRSVEKNDPSWHPMATKSVNKIVRTILVQKSLKMTLRPKRIDDASKYLEYKYNYASSNDHPRHYTPKRIASKLKKCDAPVSTKRKGIKNKTNKIIDQQKNSTFGNHRVNASNDISTHNETAEPNADLAYIDCNGSSLTEHDLPIPENRKHQMRLRKPSQNFKRLMSTLRKKPKRELMSDESKEENMEQERSLVDWSMGSGFTTLNMMHKKLQQKNQLSKSEYVEAATHMSIEAYMGATVYNPVKSNGLSEEDMAEMADENENVPPIIADDEFEEKFEEEFEEEFELPLHYEDSSESDDDTNSN